MHSAHPPPAVDGCAANRTPRVYICSTRQAPRPPSTAAPGSGSYVLPRSSDRPRSGATGDA
ncbi:hypothetical protein BDY21DRAFT_357567 [Lineolata rhizophorae]|uniref:Uncharacterized protein n=1 Tax=Lineolata rhizophorae TaxID=578093 RepID=A0A6A6NML3_9PEZI|nr:hypothetical protein BDY21DRAFT_357567 [Lineolata rhizophorae]